MLGRDAAFEGNAVGFGDHVAMPIFDKVEALLLLERRLEVRDAADVIIDTSNLTLSALKEKLAHAVSGIADVNRALLEATHQDAEAGLVAIEQMMEGRVVIASAIGGLKEVVGEGGLLFPPGDATALAERIRGPSVFSFPNRRGWFRPTA